MNAHFQKATSNFVLDYQDSLKISCRTVSQGIYLFLPKTGKDVLLTYSTVLVKEKKKNAPEKLRFLRI